MMSLCLLYAWHGRRRILLWVMDIFNYKRDLLCRGDGFIDFLDEKNKYELRFEF